MDMSDRDDADPGQDQEWLRESDLINGGLIILGVYMVQPFLTAASLDLPARICVVAFSVTIPLLAALVLVNRRARSPVPPATPSHSPPPTRGDGR
jgi:hypothetical protein